MVGLLWSVDPPSRLAYLSWLHLVSAMEETVTRFLSGFKHFHGLLPAAPDHWPPRARTGKVRPLRQSLTPGRGVRRSHMGLHYTYPGHRAKNRGALVGGRLPFSRDTCPDDQQSVPVMASDDGRFRLRDDERSRPLA
jgi:hypothetical protein